MANGDGYTKFPNWLLDEALPNCDSSEWAILCAVVRTTTGWGKESEKMSITDFSSLTGIKGRQNITRAVKSLLEKGYLCRLQDGQAFIYSVPTSNESLPVTKDNQSRIITSTSNDSLPELVTKSNQFTPILKKERKLKKEEDIYIAPLPDSVSLMISAIAQISGVTYADHLNGKQFEDTAYALIGNDITPDDLQRFGVWWSTNGHYSGKPAIKSILTKVKAAKDAGWVDLPKLSTNGNGRHQSPDSTPNTIKAATSYAEKRRQFFGDQRNEQNNSPE